MSEASLSIDRASFGVAGPVVDGKAKLTNLRWVMDERQLGDALNLPSVRLLNDLNAIAHGVPHLEPDDLHTLNEGHCINGGALAVVAPGTGLGQAFLTLDGDRYRVHPSEGGHADFAPADELQAGLYRYLQERCNPVSWERVCSGRGVPNIYDYLRDSGCAEEPSWLAEQLASAPDRTPIIVNAALNPESGCELCIATLDAFMSILGSVAGNFALQVLATGGVYLGGGIPPRILSLLQAERFMKAFTGKDSYEDLLHKVPVRIILHPEVALFGAACHGLELTPD
jgi:glucokinase